jgi:threonine synthase
MEGTYDEANRACAAYAARADMPFVNISYRPFYAQGAKTLAFEVVEQLNWSRLDHLVLPVAGATLMTRVDRALRELVQVGLLASDSVRLHAAQPAGSAPVADAILAGSSEIVPCQPDTIAHSLAIGAPADGGRAARAVTRRGGWAAIATDSEMLDAIGLLGRLEGVYAEPAGGVVVAAARHLAEEGRFGPEETVVLAITGHGWKASSGVSPGTDGSVPEPIACDPAALEAAIEGVGRGR